MIFWVGMLVALLSPKGAETFAPSDPMIVSPPMPPDVVLASNTGPVTYTFQALYPSNCIGNVLGVFTNTSTPPLQTTNAALLVTNQSALFRTTWTFNFPDADYVYFRAKSARLVGTNLIFSDWSIPYPSPPATNLIVYWSDTGRATLWVSESSLGPWTGLTNVAQPVVFGITSKNLFVKASRTNGPPIKLLWVTQ